MKARTYQRLWAVLVLIAGILSMLGGLYSAVSLPYLNPITGTLAFIIYLLGGALVLYGCLGIIKPELLFPDSEQPPEVPVE